MNSKEKFAELESEVEERLFWLCSFQILFRRGRYLVGVEVTDEYGNTKCDVSYGNKPYNNVEELNKALEELLSTSDEVIHLEDFDRVFGVAK